VTLAAALSLFTTQPVLAAGNLTLPFAIPNPRVTSWTDHHYPTREEDGLMVRFDGASGYAYDGHRGTDYAVPSNTPVVAADEGTVIYSEWSESGGWGVVIDHATDRTAYFHNNQLFVYPGQHVSRGQLIALSGSTGNSTGPHVHFEVRDLQTSWHSVDPYGWTGKGQDPWPWDMGYLWTSSPPVPFLLPLAFFGGARWDYWYGGDGPPPPVSWRLRDGGHGLAGFAARWDTDPGTAAARTQATSGSAAVPGPGAHTLHLRVFDRAGASADVTYLYLYDVEPPSSSLSLDRPAGDLLALHWAGGDSLSGLSDISVEVSDGKSGFRPWAQETIAEPAAGPRLGGVRFFGQPGTPYQFRLTLRDAARNSAPRVLANGTVPASAGETATAADRAILGALPPQPDGNAASGGFRQEHLTGGGTALLGSDASVWGLAGTPSIPLSRPGSQAAAVDLAQTPSGSLRLLADGSTWYADGSTGPRFNLPGPMRLLSLSDGSLMMLGADGRTASSRPAAGAGVSGAHAVGLTSGSTLVDAALFPGSASGLAIDSSGVLHPFGGADGALIRAPSSWSLSAQPAGLVLAGSVEAPAGILSDSSGDWQIFGSMLLFPDAVVSGPLFDPTTGLPVR
jgi:hypothetical protein